MRAFVPCSPSPVKCRTEAEQSQPSSQCTLTCQIQVHLRQQEDTCRPVQWTNTSCTLQVVALSFKPFFFLKLYSLLCPNKILKYMSVGVLMSLVILDKYSILNSWILLKFSQIFLLKFSQQSRKCVLMLPVWHLLAIGISGACQGSPCTEVTWAQLSGEEGKFSISHLTFNKCWPHLAANVPEVLFIVSWN